MTIIGRWDSSMKTPIGSVRATFVFDEVDGELRGVAEGATEVVELRDLVVERQHDGSELVRWSQSVTKPMRLNLDFEVTIAGDSLDGFSRAGRLPRSVVTGKREPS